MLGGNASDTVDQFEKAIKKFEGLGWEVVKKSAIYLSPSWGYASENVYKNQAIEVNAQLSAEELLTAILDIERQLGRVRGNSVDYQDRSIDIDILLVGNRIIDTDILKVPHPRLPDRRFALMPLAEIAAKQVHPILEKTIQELLLACKDLSKVAKG